MYVHIRNSPNGRIFRYTSRISGETTEFYAERGLIKIHHCGKRGDEEYEIVPRRDFLCRAKAINDSLAVKQPSDEKRDQQRLVDMMVTVARNAGGQGDPLSHVKNAAALTGRVRGRSMSVSGFLDLPAAPRPPMHKPPVPLDTVAPQRLPPKLIIPGR